MAGEAWLIVRGRARLVWEYEGTRTITPDGNFMMIAVRQDNEWRIRLLTWNDDSNDWIQEPVGQETITSGWQEQESFTILPACHNQE